MVVNAVITAAAFLMQAAPSPPQGPVYAFCYASVDNVAYYSPIYVGGSGDERDKAAFSAAIARERGGAVSTSFCTSRPSAAEILAVRDEYFAEDSPDASRSEVMPPWGRVAPIEGAATPGPVVRADGSAEHPLILNCSAGAGGFSSMTRIYEPSNNVLVKIAGNAVYLWKPSSSVWLEHPCVQETKDGQFCSITPTRFLFRDTYELTPGADEVNELDIRPPYRCVQVREPTGDAGRSAVHPGPAGDRHMRPRPRTRKTGDGLLI